MPEATDISFQPKQDSYTFKKQKVGNLMGLLHLVIGKKYLLITLTIFILIQIVVLNYFNFLPLSNTFPKILGFLPHKYYLTETESALRNVPYSQDYKGFYIEAILVTVASDKIAINYNNKTAEFILSSNLKCEKIVLSKYSNGDNQMSNETVFCDELLKRENIGKKTNLIYQKTSQGYYVLSYLAIQEKK